MSEFQNLHHKTRAAIRRRLEAGKDPAEVAAAFGLRYQVVEAFAEGLAEAAGTAPKPKGAAQPDPKKPAKKQPEPKERCGSATATMVLRAMAEIGAPVTLAGIKDYCANYSGAVGSALEDLEARGCVERVDSSRGVGTPHRWRLVGWPDWAGPRPVVQQPPARLQPAKRRCLGCNKKFKSKWCGNRMCDGCKAAAERVGVSA